MCYKNSKLKTQKSKLRNSIHYSLSTVHCVKGFTLLEIMIALAIVSTAVIAIFNTVNYHADIAYEHTLTTKMFLMAKEKISEMEINPVNQKGAFPDSDFSYEATVQPSKSVANGEDGGILELKVIIKGHGKEIELSQLFTKKQH